MILIDDQLLVRVVGGVDVPEPVASSRRATTYGYQYRALRAVRKDQRDGAIRAKFRPTTFTFSVCAFCTRNHSVLC